MCVVSAVGDYYKGRWAPLFPNDGYGPTPVPNSPMTPDMFKINLLPQVSREEFEALRKEVHEMRDLLIKAKEIDEKTGQPDCEMESKVELLKKMAEIFGVDLSMVFPSGSAK